MSNPCYNPSTFSPDGQALLQKPSWVQIQLYLEDALKLPLTKAQFPDERVLPIFNTLHKAASDYKQNTLPKAFNVAKNLEDFGLTLGSSFDAIVQLLAPDTTDVDTQNNIAGLFQNLLDSATNQGRDAAELATDTKTFADVLEAQVSPLANFLKADLDQQADLKLKLQPILLDVDSQKGIIKEAQNRILSDKKTIDDTKYYAWIPLIGTIVAVALIVTSQNDIKAEIEKIKQATSALIADNEQINQLNANIAQLKYAADFSSSQEEFLTKVLPNIAKIEGAWSTISGELGNVLKNVKQADAAELKGQKCLAAVSLTTAMDEWEEVVNDAHSFMENFYVVDAGQSAAAASMA